MNPPPSQLRHRWKTRLLSALFPTLVFLAVLSIWHASVVLLKIPKIVLPTPAVVASAAWEFRQELTLGAWATGKAAAVGLLASVLIGSVIAMLFSQSRWLRLSFYPYVIFLQTVPIVAIAPLLIIWSGSSFRTIALITTIISIFPIIANVTAGLLAVEQSSLELFQLYRASRWQILWKLRVPTAIAYLLVGLRISCGLAVIGAIIGESFVGNATSYDGLGTLMTQWQTRQKTDALMAAIATSTILGVLFFLFVHLLSRTILYRWTMAIQAESHS